MLNLVRLERQIDVRMAIEGINMCWPMTATDGKSHTYLAVRCRPSTHSYASCWRTSTCGIWTALRTWNLLTAIRTPCYDKFNVCLPFQYVWKHFRQEDGTQQQQHSKQQSEHCCHDLQSAVLWASVQLLELAGRLRCRLIQLNSSAHPDILSQQSHTHTTHDTLFPSSTTFWNVLSVVSIQMHATSFLDDYPYLQY